MKKALSQELHAALDLHRTGALKQARSRYEGLLAQAPDWAAPQQLLGLCILELEGPQTALPMLERACELAPDDAEFRYNLAVCLQRLKRPTEALETVHTCLARQPDHLDARHLRAEIHAGLAHQYEQSQNLPLAVEHLSAALSDWPEQSKWRVWAAELLLRLDRPKDAARLLTEPAGGLDRSSDAWALRSRAFLDQGEDAAALASGERALTLDGTNYAAHSAVGCALRALGRAPAAIKAFETALALRPEDAVTAFNLSLAQQDVGQLEHARESLNRCLSWRQDFAAAWIQRVHSTPQGAHDPAWEHSLLKVLETASLSPREQSDVHFALAWLLDGLQRYDAAWPHFAAANKIRFGLAPVDHGGFVDRVHSILQQASSPAPTGQTQDSAHPILVVGMPRSGTTLLTQMLSAHPDIVSAGELNALARIAQSSGYASAPRRLDHPGRYRAEYRVALETYGRPESAGWVIDKMPVNLLWVDLFRQLYPDGQVIAITRRWDDVSWSCFSQPFATGNEWAFDQGAINAWCRGAATLLSGWRQTFSTGFHEVSYAALVEQPKSTLAPIITALGLTWDDRCADPTRSESVSSTASNVQVRAGLRLSHGRWRPYRSHLDPMFRGLSSLADNEPA